MLPIGEDAVSSVHKAILNLFYSFMIDYTSIETG